MTRIGVWGPLLVLVLVLAGGFISFFWLPRAQLDVTGTWLDAFRASLGVPESRQAGLTVPIKARSDLVLTHTLLGSPEPGDIGHGATLALRCTPCHGPTGISYANSPNLAGQYAVAIYKQLHDYKFGVRSNAIMTPMAEALSDSDMRQIAAYYSSLEKPPEARLNKSPPPIVLFGAPMRNVAPCGSCHGDIDHTLASPWLKGEPTAYLLQQLQEFAAGARSNDINGQMRAMARGMTPSEMQAAAQYYSAQSPAP
jgi:cytochrome c553